MFLPTPIVGASIEWVKGQVIWVMHCLSVCLYVCQHFWCDAITKKVIDILVLYFAYMLVIIRGRHLLFFSPIASVIQKLWALYWFLMWLWCDAITKKVFWYIGSIFCIIYMLGIIRGRHPLFFSLIALVIQMLWALYWFLIWPNNSNSSSLLVSFRSYFGLFTVQWDGCLNLH